MKRQHYPSIFNDVLAPVTQGPSSSNTVGPFRIGTIARALLKGEPRVLKIKMSTGGGYFATFYNMDSDKGFLAGILGKDLIGDDLSQVYEDAKEAGLKYEFKFRDDVPSVPSELAVLTVTSDLEELNMRCVSLGGGEILISELDGKTCHIKGIYEEEIEVRGETRTLPSVYPLRVDPGAEPPFRNSEEMLAYVEEQGKELWEAAVDYEMSLTSLSAEEVFEAAEKTLKTAYRAIERGFEPGVEFEGVTVAKAPEIREKMKTARLIPTGVGDKGGLAALAVLEYGNSHGIIV